MNPRPVYSTSFDGGQSKMNADVPYESVIGPDWKERLGECMRVACGSYLEKVNFENIEQVRAALSRGEWTFLLKEDGTFNGDCAI